MNNVLIISEFGSEDQNSTGHLVSQIPQLLDGTTVEILDATSMTRPLAQLYEWLSKRQRLGLLKRFVVGLGLITGALFRRNKYDAVIVTSNPFISLLIAPFIWRGKQSRFYYLTFDLFPETLKATSFFMPKLLYRSILYCRNRNLRHADGVFAIGRDMKRHLETLGLSRRVSYVPLWIGATEIPVVSQYKKESVSLSGGKSNINRHLHFFGNIGHVQDFRFLFKIVTEIDSLVLDVYGSGPKAASLMAHASNKVTFHGAVDFTKRAEIFKPGIIGVVPQSLDLVGLAVPSKAFYYWSRGLPILYLGSLESEVAKIIHSNPVLGIVVTPNKSLSSLELKIDNLASTEASDEIKLICSDLKEEAARAFRSELGLEENEVPLKHPS